nr:toll like receptor 25 [Syngnathoides biaculeatus]
MCVTSRWRVADLSNQNLTSFPLNLPDTTEYLDVSHNPIQSISADAFPWLRLLCFLKATHCGLRVISPTVFQHTPALQVLDMSSNELTTIPDISLPRLTILELTDNLYEAYQLPDCFRNLTNLQVLTGMNILPCKLLSVLPTLETLDVSDNLLTDLGFWWPPCSNTSVFPKLKHLLLNKNRFSKFTRSGLKINELSLFTFRKLPVFEPDRPEMWTVISPGVFQHTPGLQLLDMSSNELTIIPDISLPRLTVLDLSDNLYEAYQLPDSALSVNLNDFKPVTSIPLEHLVLGAGNLWLSSSQNISFINVTYNEDTPDGLQFQFHPVNHSISLRSVTFNGVIHHQYKYPTFNMSFDDVSNVNYVKFSRSGMNILPCKLLSVLPTLETLDVSDNLLSDLGFWWPPCSNTSVFPKLKHLLLSKNRFSSLSFISGQTHKMKQLESLDLSFNSIYLDVSCKWPAHLTELNLGNNNLGNKRIYLSKTGITAINQEDLSRFPKLTHLHLSANSVQVLPELLDAPNLISFFVDRNAITGLSRYVFAGFPKLQLLQAGNNPFVCSCDLHWFLKDFNKSLLLDWPLDYSCSTPKQLKGLPLSEYKTSVISCEIWLQTTVAFSVLLLVATTLGLLFYKLDGAWYTKMLWVWIRVKRRGKKRSYLLKNMSFSYHAFISYSHRDAKFVSSELVPSLESVGISLCVHERDFLPGEFIIDNIINCVESSYKTLFLLSKHFVQSEWCNYELFFAQHRAINIQEDSLVFILLEPIPTDCLPKKYLRLRTLLQQQTYLEWPKDECKQQVFWASLKSMLRMADKSVVLRGVAVDLADTAHLLPNQA